MDRALFEALEKTAMFDGVKQRMASAAADTARRAGQNFASGASGVLKQKLVDAAHNPLAQAGAAAGAAVVGNSMYKQHKRDQRMERIANSLEHMAGSKQASFVQMCVPALMKIASDLVPGLRNVSTDDMARLDQMYKSQAAKIPAMAASPAAAQMSPHRLQQQLRLNSLAKAVGVHPAGGAPAPFDPHNVPWAAPKATAVFRPGSLKPAMATATGAAAHLPAAPGSVTARLRSAVSKARALV